MAISAGAAKNSIPFSGITALPILFAAGMSLMDTADGMFMTTAYDWALSTPIRKVYYNLTITGLSVVAAWLIGLIEAMQVVFPALGLTNGVWGWLATLNFSRIGMMLVGLFVLTWAISFGTWKLLRIEQRWSSNY